MPAIFLGLDLAWSQKNPSGLAALDERGAVVDFRADLVSDREVLEWVRRHARPTTVLGIDMPTIVRNASGVRACEKALSAVFARHHAGPHPANLGRPDFRDGGRARRLLDELASDGFVEDLDLAPRSPGRFAFEVFPHPAHVRLFGRDSIFRYKKKQGRSWSDVYAAWSAYRQALAGLADAVPPLHLPDDLQLTPGAKGKEYKRLDDLLDALTCAYVAAFAWHWGTAPPLVRVFGNLADGYILIPDSPAIRMPADHPHPASPAQESMSKTESQPFLTDVKELRRRAKEHIENGAITENYGGDVQQTIDILQAVLATEIVCVLRYTAHAVAANGIDSESVAEEFHQHADEEREHMMAVANRINQLGGTPDFNPAGLMTRSASEYGKATLLIDMIKENLIAERIAVEHYRELIRFFGDKDPTTRVMIEEILGVEEEHANDMHDLLVAREGRPMLPN